MRTRNLLLIGFLFLFLAASAASADSVIRFNDGRYLKVATCEVKEDWVRISLEGGDSSMWFPVTQVEHIETDDRIVYARSGSPETVTRVAALTKAEARSPTRSS